LRSFRIAAAGGEPENVSVVREIAAARRVEAASAASAFSLVTGVGAGGGVAFGRGGIDAGAAPDSGDGPGLFTRGSLGREANDPHNQVQVRTFAVGVVLENDFMGTISWEPVGTKMPRMA
jgi:hypothetical protein